MKRSGKIIKQYAPWLLLLFGIDALAALLLWIADAQAFEAMVTVIVLITILLFSVLCGLLCFRELKKEKLFLAFLNSPDEYHEEQLLRALSGAQMDRVRLLAQALRDHISHGNQIQLQLADYEEYVEAWAHETKTPLSLLTLLVDNHRDELSEPVNFKLDYIRNRMQESVDQMLYYARLKGSQKDYLFESVRLRTCIDEVLEDYRPLLEEKQFQMIIQVSDEEVYTDRRGFRFLLGQIVSNAVKYSGDEPEIIFMFNRKGESQVLTVRDNGTGVRNCDLPYIFEKGFTGKSGGGRKKATGMGLYLAKEMSKDLRIALDAKSQWGKGFEMQISFPVIDT